VRPALCLYLGLCVAILYLGVSIGACVLHVGACNTYWYNAASSVKLVMVHAD
jgi:hypothetical protein